MKLNSILLSGLLALAPTGASALVESDLSPLTPIKANFSSTFHNRIVFDGAAVVQAISTARGVELKADENSGQMFLTTNGKPVVDALISFVLDTGDVQDVLLDFVKRPSEVLLVRCCVECECVEEESVFCKTDIRDPSQIKSIINAAVAGRIPGNLSSLPFSGYRKQVSRGVVLNRIGKFGSEDQIVYLYELHNTRMRPVQIEEKELYHDGGLWTYIENNRIGAKDKTVVVVAVEPRSDV